MLKLLFAVIALMVFSPVNAQQKQIDSLLTLLGTPLLDTVKGDVYNNIGRLYMDNNNTLAIQYFDKAIDIRSKHKQQLKLGNSYYSVGYCYLQKSEYAKSLDNYLKSINIYVQLKDNHRLFNGYLSVANVYMDNNDYKKAWQYLDDAEALTRRLKNNEMLGSVLDEKGLLYDHLAKYDSALMYHQRAYNLSANKGDDYATAAYVSNIGLTYKHLHNTVKAMECFNRAMDIVVKDKMPDDVKANVYNNIAVTYADEGNYAAARQNFDNSISLGKRLGMQSVVMENYRNLADMYAKMKDYRHEAFYLRKYYLINSMT